MKKPRHNCDTPTGGCANSLPGKYIGTHSRCQNNATVETVYGWKCKLHSKGLKLKTPPINNRFDDEF